MAEKVVIDLEVDVNKSERTLGQLEDRAEKLNEEFKTDLFNVREF